jgi:hypothetical protein
MKAAAKPKKKFFTVHEANAMLPLVRRILQDITALATDLRDRYQRLAQLQKIGGLDQAHREEVQHLAQEFERGRDQMQEFEQEIARLGIELKDSYVGLIDFPHLKDGREVYLCWKLGEERVSYWHEVDAGFAGRQELAPPVLKG